MANRLRELRKKSKLTQKELADTFSLSESIISLYETDARQPSNEILIKFCDYFDVSIDYFLMRTDEVGPAKSSIPSFTFEQMQAMAAKEGITLTRRDELDITKRIKELHDDLASPETLMMSGGERLDDESRQALLQLLEQVEIMSKILAKKKFTPKKYRKSEKP